MSKKIAKLEKETSVWKMKWESNHKALVQVAGEKQQLSKQLTQLQKLCRTLQADRTSLLSQLKSEGIEPKLSGIGTNSHIVGAHIIIYRFILGTWTIRIFCCRIL